MSSHGLLIKTNICSILRILPGFAGVLWKKIRTRASFNKPLTNYIQSNLFITDTKGTGINVRNREVSVL